MSKSTMSTNTMSTSVMSTHGSPRTAAAKRKGLLRRFYDRLIEARMQKAMLEIERHRHLLPRELELAGWKITERSESSLPFTR